MTAIGTDPLIAMSTRLKLTAIRDQLDSILDEAAWREFTIREPSTQYRWRAATRVRLMPIQRRIESETKGSRISRGETYTHATIRPTKAQLDIESNGCEPIVM